jgi:probable F420-dependent oxidoreductase
MPHDRKFRFAVQHTHAPDGAAWLAMARRAEDSGVSVFSLPDHLGDQFAPIPALAAVAAVTSTIRLSMFVLANDNRHPGILAKEIATLDTISHGRVELGMGAGWTRTEYDSLGMTFDTPGVRIERLGEAVKILRGCFTEEKFSFTGKHYKVTDLAIRPRPVRSSGIPIVLGGGGKKMLSLAAREADIVSIAANNQLRPSMSSPLTGFAHAQVSEQAGWVREAAGARFDGIELNVRVLAVAIHPDREAAARELSAGLGVPPEDLLDSPFAFIGTLQQIEDQVQRIRDELGISYFTISQRHAAPLLPLIGRMTGR